MENNNGDILCDHCKEILISDDVDEEIFECDNCNGDFCEECVYSLDNVTLCIDCIGKFPNKTVEKEKIVEKFVTVDAPLQSDGKKKNIKNVFSESIL